MTRRKGRAGARRDRNSIIFGCLILFVIVMVSGGTGYYIFTSKDGLDDRLCPPGGPIGHTILLVDKTDPMTFSQKEAFVRLLAELSERRSIEVAGAGAGNLNNRVGVGELFSVFVLGEDFKETPKPVFEMCKPGKGSDSGVWLANPKKLERVYVEKFDEPLKKVEALLISEVPAKHSPIMEMLQMVAVNGFRANDTAGKRRLIVVSDMLHNTSEYSQFKAIGSFVDFKNAPYFQKVRTEFTDVNVVLFYLMYSPSLQTNKNAVFWEEYFREQGGSVNSAKPCC